MSLYIYTTKLYKPTSDIVGKPDNTFDLSDFDTNHKSSAVQVSSIEIAQTAFVIEKTYAQFDALVSTPFDWTDVRYVDNPRVCELYLITSNPL